MTKAKQKMLHTFNINYISDVDDTRYIGTFTCKKLSIMDIAALGVRKAQLNGGMYYDERNPGKGVDFETDDYNAMLSHLEISLVNTPNWWDLRSISDVDLITAVYREVAKFEASFLERRRRAGSANGSVGSSSDSGGGTVSETYAAGSVTEVVGEEVLAALEP